MVEDDNKGIKQTKEDYGSLFDFGEAKPESGQIKEAVSINNSFGSLEKKVSEDTYNPIDEKAEHDKYLSQMLLLSFNGAKKKKKKKVFIAIFVALIYISGITFGIIRLSFNAFYDNFVVPKEYIEELYESNNYNLSYHNVIRPNQDSYADGVRDVYYFTDEYLINNVVINYFRTYEDAYKTYNEKYIYFLDDFLIIHKGNTIVLGTEEAIAIMDLSNKEIFDMYSRMIDDGIEMYS